MTPVELALAEQVGVQLASALSDYLTKKASGTLTIADVNAVAQKAGLDLDTLAADIAMQK